MLFMDTYLPNEKIPSSDWNMNLNIFALCIYNSLCQQFTVQTVLDNGNEMTQILKEKKFKLNNVPSY